MIDVSSILANARERTRREKEAIPLLSGDTRPASPSLYDPTEAALAGGYVGMMDRLDRRPAVSDTGHHDGAERQEQFRRRWQVPKITELADYRVLSDEASTGQEASKTSEVVASEGSRSSNSEVLKVAERAASRALSGNIVWFPTPRTPASQTDYQGDLPDRGGEGFAVSGVPQIADRTPRATAPSPGPALILLEELEVLYCSGKDHDCHKAFLAVREEHALHAAKPDLPAWQNLLATEEGPRMISQGVNQAESWAKATIWRYIHGKERSSLKSNNINSAKFLEHCRLRGDPTLIAMKLCDWGDAADLKTIEKRVKRYLNMKKCIAVGKQNFPHGYPAPLDDTAKSDLLSALTENRLPQEAIKLFLPRLKKALAHRLS
jgi:hypothetical protein